MNDVRDLLKERYEKEADDVLFKDLQFDERLREQVWQKISSFTPKVEKRKSHPLHTKRWFRVPAVAAIAVVIIASASTLYKINMPAEDLSLQNGPDNTNQVMEGAISDDSSIIGDSGMYIESVEQTWELNSPDHASALMGGIAVTPSYIPERFTLAHVNGEGITLEQISRITVTYNSHSESEEAQLTITITNQPQIAGQPSVDNQPSGTDVIDSPGTDVSHFEKIEINGGHGYLITGEKTELTWVVEGITYKIEGDVTVAEIVQMAQSF